MQIGLGVGAFHDDDVANTEHLIEISGEQFHSVSLAWHTRVPMSDPTTPPDPDPSQGGDTSDFLHGARSELEQIVRRVVDTVTMIAAKASSFALRLVIAVSIVCIGGFLLGVAALDGGIEQVWIVLGVVFGAIAIGGPLVAMYRVASVKRHVPELVNEVRSLISTGRETGRTVIDTFDADDPDRPDGDQSAIVLTRRVYGLRGAVSSGLEGSARLTAAVTALTSFPGLVLAAVAITIVFAFLGFVFLIALAL